MLRGRYPHAAFWLKIHSMFIDMALSHLFLQLHNIQISVLCLEGSDAAGDTNPYLARTENSITGDAAGDTNPYRARTENSITAITENSETITAITAITKNSDTITASIMASKRGRPRDSTHVNLDRAAAFEFFEAHLVTASGPALTFPYSKGRSTDVKKSFVWSEVKLTLN